MLSSVSKLKYIERDIKQFNLDYQKYENLFNTCKVCGYNKGYNVWVFEFEKDMPLICYNGSVLKPFHKHSNTKWSYPIVNVNGDLQYCHRIVNFTIGDINHYKSLRLKYKAKDIITNHINGDVSNYRSENLEYLDTKTNQSLKNARDTSGVSYKLNQKD